MQNLSDEQIQELANLTQKGKDLYQGATASGEFSIMDLLAAMQAGKNSKYAEKRRKKIQALAASGLFDPEFLAKTAGNKLGEMERKDMPQVQAWQAKDDGVPMGKLEFVDPNKLKYTQEKINGTKARGIANHWDTVGKEPILISKDNWVLDGHHRVEAARMKHKWVRCFRVDLPGRTALNRLKEIDAGTQA